MQQENMQNTQLFARNLQNWRLKHGFSKGKLADLLGLSLRTIDNYEDGRHKLPAMHKIRNYAEKLHVDAESLIGEVQQDNAATRMTQSPNHSDSTNRSLLKSSFRLKTDPSWRNKLTFAERLRWLRDSRNMSEPAFAQHCGCDTSYISKLESGVKTNPSPEFIKNVTQRFYVLEPWLLNGDGEPFAHEPEFYDFRELKPGDVAFESNLIPHYALLSTELLIKAMEEIVKTLPSKPQYLDEYDFILDNIIAIATELAKRSRNSKLETPIIPEKYPKVEANKSALWADRARMIRDGDEPSVLVSPSELEEAVKGGIKVDWIKTSLWDSAARKLVVQELSSSQIEALRAWEDYWEKKRAGENPEEPPHLNSNGNAPQKPMPEKIKLNYRPQIVPDNTDATGAPLPGDPRHDDPLNY